MFKRANIVQVEFFHVGKKCKSLEELAADCQERVDIGSPIKTVVRFNDECGNFTAMALKGKKLESRTRQLLKDFNLARRMRRWFLASQMQRLMRKQIALHEEAQVLVQKELRRIVRSSRSLAIERSNRSFRPLHSGEAHELMESIVAATGMWLFVFEPNSLLSDENRLIASLR